MKKWDKKRKEKGLKLPLFEEKEIQKLKERRRNEKKVEGKGGTREIILKEKGEKLSKFWRRQWKQRRSWRTRKS